ncbi:MAG: periplasmic heavy metal sensor [Bradyrhizobiaceae bacterium]|nr:periplasmic heavy metal sensor [Bradyrhizobiaceae bacterium]
MTTEQSPEQPTHRRRPWRTTFTVVVTAFVAAALGAFVNQSFGQGFGPPWHHMLAGPPSEAQIEDHADRMVRHLAIEIDANAEQQSKLQTIVKSAVKDLVPMRDKFLAVRQQARDLLTQASIDRGAIEKLRADQIAAVDAFSKRLVQALDDAAEALTPEQRQKINDFLPPPGSHWRHWHL